MSKADWIKAAQEQKQPELMHMIMTACKKPGDFVADPRLLSYLGNRRELLKVLDFGCGLGRNCLGIARFSDKWEVMGYDLTPMIERAHRYIPSTTTDKDILDRIHLTDSMQTAVEEYSPDVALACFCLQHIDKSELLDILPWMGDYIPKLIVSGRTWMDDGTMDAFALVEACGWRITKTHERDAANPLGEHRVVEYASPASHRI